MKKLIYTSIVSLSLIFGAFGQTPNHHQNHVGGVHGGRAYTNGGTHFTNHRYYSNNNNHTYYDYGHHRFLNQGHDRFWWHSHYTRIILIGGCWYYWNDGCYWPALGYDPVCIYSNYNPICY